MSPALENLLINNTLDEIIDAYQKTTDANIIWMMSVIEPACAILREAKALKEKECEQIFTS